MQADAMKARFGNYGTPNPAHASGLYSIPLDTLHDRCTFDYSPVASAFPSFIMNHFANNTAYDAFKGTDYTPHNLEHYPTHSHWRNGLKPQLADHSAVGGALCDLPPSSSGDDGGLHHTIMRVGPFTSNGGYDWWQYAGHDTLSLSRHLEGGASIGIGSHWVTAVEAHSGRVLGYPPMHVHHIHLVPSKPWLRYQWATPSTGGWRDLLRHLTTEQGAAYYVPNYVMEQHGEWDLSCHAESLPAGYLNLIDFPLDFEGELNDGRAVGAPDLTWYLEIGLGWTSRTRDAKPLSYAVLTEDHFGMVDGHQITYENYHWVPTAGEWVNYYAGRMPAAGTLVRMKHHVHMNLMHKALFLAASADELGLHARPLGPDGGEMGAKEIPGAFASHGGALGQILFGSESGGATLDATINTWPVGVVSPAQLGASSLASLEAVVLARAAALGAAPDGGPRLKCSLTRGAYVDADGFEWDRAGNSTCAPWAFARGEWFTSVSLLTYHGGKLGPWSPKHTPPRLPSHNQWNVYFEADDGASHYFLYSALIHDATLKLRRYALRELLLMMNWRVVAPADSAPLHARLTAAGAAVRRLAPLTLLALVLAALWTTTAVGKRVIRRTFKYKPV